MDTLKNITTKLSENEKQTIETIQKLKNCTIDEENINEENTVNSFIKFSRWLKGDYNKANHNISDRLSNIKETLKHHKQTFKSSLDDLENKNNNLLNNLQKDKKQSETNLTNEQKKSVDNINMAKKSAQNKKNENISLRLGEANKKYKIDSDKIVSFDFIRNTFLLGSSKRKAELQNNLEAVREYFEIKKEEELVCSKETSSLVKKLEELKKQVKVDIDTSNKKYDKKIEAQNLKAADELSEQHKLFDNEIKEIDSLRNKAKEVENSNIEILSDLYEQNFKDDVKIKLERFSLVDFDSRAYKLFDNFKTKIQKLKEDEKKGNKNTTIDTKEIDKLRKNHHDKYIKIGNFKYNINSNYSSTKAYLPLIHANNIIFRYESEAGKEKLSKLLTSIVYREILSLMDGKIKLTIVDPIGMGDNCSSLLGLDNSFYDSVYTDDRSIEEELVKLTKFISLVNTKYLKNEYESISKYNIGVGDVEEPYQILIAYDILDSFKNESLKKVKSIIQNSTRTGIQTLLIQKTNVEHENEYQQKDNDKILKEIADMSIVISERNGDFVIDMPLNNNDKDFQLYSDARLVIDDSNLLDEVLNKNISQYLNYKLGSVGDTKVSYIEKIQDLLDSKSFWNKSASESIEANIGKSGREDQLLEINNKIEAHALLIGRSGSGKSNLLHMIITDLALNYSPDELRLYLIDMKGGIEFIRYVDNSLPHVDVTSITSDREMAHSVLQGLELELQKREELFSSNSVQNIAEYNKKNPQNIVPRVLLVLDEFQELFSKEDSIKRSAVEIFDRLSKKGRSFGINMILASQSLGGDTLPSTTIAQLAVRIVLQCSEDDSMKALSTNNVDAKLLSRPGEGIYNAKNGQTSGNERFQTYFMEDDEDEEILGAISEYAKTKSLDIKTRVFREDVRPSFEEYSQKVKVDKHSLILPIGQPYSLEDMVSIELKKEAGSNILISGIHDRLALNLFVSIFSTLALETTRKKKFYFFDTTAQNHPDYGLMRKYIDILEENSMDIVIMDKKSVVQELESIISEITEAESGKELEEEKYLFFFGLNKARSFKKPDYNLSNEAMLLSKVLADGGEHGVHTVIYADNPKGLENIFDNNTVKNDLETVIALQMSVDDSRRLIGTDSAGSLGKENAILFVENMNLVKKFRPLQLPNEKRLSKHLDQI